MRTRRFKITSNYQGHPKGSLGFRKQSFLPSSANGIFPLLKHLSIQQSVQEETLRKLTFELEHLKKQLEQLEFLLVGLYLQNEEIFSHRPLDVKKVLSIVHSALDSSKKNISPGSQSKDKENMGEN